MDDKDQVKMISSLDFDISKVNDTMKNLNSIFEKNMKELEKKVKESTANINNMLGAIGGININAGSGIGDPKQAAREINKTLANVMVNAVKHLNKFIEKLHVELSEQEMAHAIQKDVENIDKEIAKYVRRSINLATSDIREELQRVPVWARSKGGAKLDDVAYEVLNKFPALEGYGGNTPSEMLLNFFDTYKAYNTTKKQLLEDMNKTTQDLAKVNDYAGRSINEITDNLTKNLETVLNPKELDKFKGLSFEGKRDYLINLLQKYRMSLDDIADESTQRIAGYIDDITGQSKLTPTKSDHVKQAVNNLNTAQENLQKRIVNIINDDIRSISEIYKLDKLNSLKLTNYFDKDGNVSTTAETHTADMGKLQTDAYDDLLNLTKQLYDLENKRTGASEKQLEIIKYIENAIEEQMSDVYKIIDGYGLENAELEKMIQLETAKLGNKVLLKRAKTEETEEEKKLIALEKKRIDMQNALPKMEATAATIQQTVKTKELSAELLKQAGTLREQINLMQEKLTKEGKLTNEEVEQTAELKKQLDLLQQQTKTAAADKPLQPTVRESPFMARMQTALSYGMIYKGIQAMKEATKTISEVEMGITEIARVSNDAAFNFDKVRDKVIQLGIDYGQTFENVQHIALRWRQSGYETSDALELTKTSLLALNTAELDANAATESMIGIMAQWNLEAKDLSLVLDKINKVADSFSLTSQDLVDGLLRASGAARVMGLDIDHTIALLTTMREASGRTGREVGNALNSILSYIQRAGSIKVIESMGIRMFADEARTQFRNVFEVFQELADKWNDPNIAKGAKDALMAGAEEAGLFAEELANVVGMQEEHVKMLELETKATEEFTDVQKRDAAQAAAGVFRRNYFIGLLERFATTQKALTVASEAEGYSMRENARTMETLEKKVQALKTSYVALAVAIGEAGLLDSLKDITDAMKDNVEAIAKLDSPMKNLIINLGIVLGTIKAVKTTANLLGLEKAVAALGTVVSGPVAAALITSIGLLMTIRTHVRKLAEEKRLFLEGSGGEEKAEIENLEAMIAKHEELTEVSKTNAEAKEELLSLQKQLAEIYPEYVDGISDEGDKLVTNIELLKEQNRLKKEELELKIQEQIDKSPKELSDLLKRKEILEGMLEQAKSLKEHGVPDILGFDSDNDIQDIIGKLQAVNYQIALRGSFLNKQEDDYDKVEKARLKAIGALNTETDATNANTDAKAGNLALTEEQKIAEEAFVKAFNEHISNMQTYKTMLDEINSKEGLSNKSKQDIITKYQQFIPYLSDEKALREQLAKAIDDEDKAQKKLYLSKVENEESFYTTMLTNNKTLVDKLEEGYNVDLSNYKSLAKAKEEVDNEWLSAASTRWRQFYDIQSDTLKLPSGTIGLEKVDSEYNRITRAVEKLRQFNADLDSIALKGTDFKSGLDAKKVGSAGSQGISTNEALEKISRYFELEQAMDKVNLALARNKALQENTDDVNKLNTLKREEIELYKQMQQSLHELNEERRKERDELKSSLSKDFKFDGDTLLDYKTIMDKKIAEVNKHANDKNKTTYNKLKADYKEIEIAAKRYFDLVLKEIPKASEEWWKYEKTLKDAAKFEFSDDVYNKTKSQLDDLKFSLDMLGETDYADKLNNVSIQLGVTSDIAGKTFVEIEALHKLYQSGQITLTEYNERYDILKTRFQNAAKEAKALKEQQLQLEFAQFDKTLEPLNAKLNIFKNTLSGLSDTSFDEKINVLSLMIGNAGTQTSELIDEFNRLSQEPFSDAVSKRLKEINAKISQNKMSTIEWQKQLNQTHITQFLSEIDKGMQKLDRQAEQMKHNIEMMQDGILTGTDMKTLAEYGLDLDVENVYNAEILALKRNEEDRLAIIEEYDKKELEAQDDTFEEYLTKIEEQDRIKQALIDEKRAEELLKLQEYNAETITEIENFLVDLQSTYESGFDNIIEALTEKVSEIKSLIASANKAMDSLTPPKTSTPGFGSSTGARVVPKYPKEHGDDDFIGGIALVNDAKSSNYIEPIILPDGRMISFKERNVFVDLPKGTKIISAKDVPKFEDGNVSVTKSNFSMFSNDSTEFKIIEAWDSLIKKIEEQRDEAKQNIESLIEQRDAIGEGNDGYAELNEKIYEQVQIINKSNSQLKSFVKSKWDTVYKGFDTANKVYTDKADDVSELQKMNELYKNNDKYFEKAINYNAQQLDITKGLNDELTNQKNYLTEQLATLEKDSYEWGVVNGKIEAINEELEDVNYNIAQIEVEGLNLAFEGMLNGLKSVNKEIENLDYQLSLQNIINPDDYNAVNIITNKIKNANVEQVNYLTNVLNQLQQQLSLLDSASGQWSIIAGQIANVEAQIKSTNLAIAQQAKGMFSKYLTGIQGSVQKSNPKPSKSDSNDDMVSGLEKELEVQKIINFARENELTISQKQLQILNSKGAIERDTLKTIQKQLELQQLQNKLEYLKNNKTRQQYKKQDDGTWQYEYTTDEKAIYETEQAILDKKLELIKIEKDKQNKLSQASQDAAVSAFDDRMNKLNEVLKNAENRMYKSAESFKQALLKLGLNLPIDEMVAEYEKFFTTTGDILIKDAIQKTTTMLNQSTAAFKNAGNEAGASYTEGLIESIDEIVKGEGSFIQKQGQIVHMLLNRAVDFALAGNEAGLSYIEGLIGSMGTDDYMPDLNDIAIKIKDKIAITAHFMKKDGQEAGAALLEGIATGIDNILANGSIQNKTQAVLDLLNQANQYGTLGQVLGTEFMDGLIGTFTNMASQITGDGEGVLSEAINAITQQLDTKIAEFGEKGDLQGIAYAEALKAKLIEAMQDAQITQEEIIALLSQFKDFDLAGLLSGEAYEGAIEIGFEDAQTSVDEKNSAIVEGLNEDVANFGAAGAAQGEAYKNAITMAFQNAVAVARGIIGELVNYVNSQSFNVNVGVTGETSGVPQFDKGGPIDFTGMAMVHGSRTSAETAFNAADSKKLYNFVHGSGLENLMTEIDSFRVMINTDKLQRVAMATPTPSTGGSKSSETHYHIDVGEWVFPGVTNENGAKNLFKGMKQYAIQAVREKG